MNVWVDAALSVCYVHPTSDVVIFQEVGPLQHLHMSLIDFEGRAESDRQASQNVAALH